MSELERYVSEQITQIVPKYDKLEIRANIGDLSYSIEFYATIAGKRMQCYDMADEGLIRETELDAIFQNIAAYVRNTKEFIRGTTNKYSFTIGE